MHLMAMGYAGHYAQMAAIAALQQGQQAAHGGGEYGPNRQSRYRQDAPSTYAWNGELPPRNYNHPVQAQMEVRLSLFF
jgi:hypothetical protein